MQSRATTITTQRILPPVCGISVVLIILLMMNRDYPFVGHDNRYFIAKLIDTGLHLRLNGLSIQWYTPSFGGGLPAFPNPQHIEYSIVQLVSFFSHPWLAILMTTAAVSLVGYYFFYKLMREQLELDWRSSTLGAIFFLGNGFYIEHMIVGHLGFQLFPLGSLILYIIITTHANRVFYSGITVALLITLILHQAGFIISVILSLSFCITLPVLYLYKPQILHLKQIVLTCILAIILAAVMTGSKLYAVTAFMQHFPRNISDVYDVSLIQALAGVIAQLFGVMTFAPILLITGNDPSLLSGALSNITGAVYGMWELDTGLSPVLLFFLSSALIQLIANIRKSDKMKFTRQQAQAMLILLVTIWVTLELSMAKGAIYSFTKGLPILASLHVNTRFTSAFILPLVIVGAFQVDRLLSQGHKSSYFLISALLSIGFLFAYVSLNKDVHSRYVDLSLVNEIERQVQSGNSFPVSRITEQADLEAFLAYASSYKPYEAIFGYALEDFTAQIHPGSVFEEDNGYFNMTNPESLVFSETNNLQPFERFEVSERDKLKAFLERRQPEWNIPVTQRILNKLSLITVILGAGILFTTKVIEIISAVKQKNTI